jgi:glycosyltransferase involved in cell wall biosynthesis
LKKVLLITYYFDPGNAVATPRVMSWANDFYKHGIELTVVTRHFTGNESHWIDFTQPTEKEISVVKTEAFTVHYLPYKPKKPVYAESNRLLSKMYHLKEFLSGYFNPEIDAYHAFKDYCRKLLSSQKTDLILVSAPPHNLVRLASELSQEFKIPYVVDFRDIWNNRITGADHRMSLRGRLMNSTEEFYISKWLKKASLVTTVSNALVQQIKRIYSGNTAEITNGFEWRLFKPVQETSPPSDRFVVASIGTIYPVQDISILIEGLKKFYTQLDDKTRFKLNFIGLKAVDVIAQKIETELKELHPYVTAKLPRSEVMEYYKQSNILLIPAWKQFQGIYSTKIFEYLGSGRPILVAPGDDDVIDEMINKSKRGFIANTADEFVSALTHAYQKWKSGNLPPLTVTERELFYSRENQAKILADKILLILK